MTTFAVPTGHGDRPTANSRGTRSPVLARNGMVATSQPLASAAALRVLQNGGNAVDAAITAAAMLNVVEPVMTGIGGDMFALVYMQREGKPVALNGSGYSGSRASLDFFRSRGMTQIPDNGIYSVSVPGAVAGWCKLHERYGATPLRLLLAPAIDYAAQGFPVSDVIAGQWRRVEAKLRQTRDAARTYLHDGNAPQCGEVFKNINLSKTLQTIAEGGRDAFYKGEIAEKIVRFSNLHDGLLSLADFAEFDAQWVEPVRTNYRGYDVFELGANTQGLVALEMLNIIEGFDLGRFVHNSADYVHLLVEAKKLAFADRDAYIADPDRVAVPVETLISKEYAAERRKQIDLRRAQPAPPPGIPDHGDTVYLTVVDGEGNAVSFINSIFHSFGSGLVAGDTGIVLHNRGCLFQLDSRHPNCVEPRKRPFHTLIPAMVLKNNKPFFSFGVMGGDMQPQGHVQVLANLIDFAMDVQQAGEAPRFRHSQQGLALESEFGAGVRYGLSELGHEIVSSVDVFGGYQGIRMDPESGVLMGGSDPRKDGLAIGW